MASIRRSPVESLGRPMPAVQHVPSTSCPTHTDSGELAVIRWKTAAKRKLSPLSPPLFAHAAALHVFTAGAQGMSSPAGTSGSLPVLAYAHGELTLER